MLARCRLIILHPLKSSCRMLSSSSQRMQQQKVEVDGIMLNYEKVGKGNHAVLCMPGALGTCRTDFGPQLDNLCRENFTIIAWDPPGYGKSRPPDRTFPLDMFQRDAKLSKNLMETLNLPKFSILGWSDGGITGLILAANYPENVKKLVVWGANAYVTNEDLAMYEKIRNIDSWSEKMKAPLIAMYGEDYFRQMWASWVDLFISFVKDRQGDICKADLSKITCPTFIIHGQKDPMVPSEHPVYLQQNIKDNRLHVMKEGKHNLHLRYADEFNKMVEDFLKE